MRGVPIVPLFPFIDNLSDADWVYTESASGMGD